MERAMLGRFGIFCTLLAVALQVCLASVTVKVNPLMEVIKGNTVRLPCDYTVSPPIAPAEVDVEWFTELSDGTRKQVASDRYTMGADKSLTISPVTVDDNKTFVCQVTAGTVGVDSKNTQLMVFSAPEKPVITGNNRAIPVSKDDEDSSEVGKCVSKNGFPEPRIIWFKDDTPLPEEKRITEKTYMLTSLVREASGLFTMASMLFMQLAKTDAKSVFHCTVEYSMPNEQMKQESSNKFNLTLLYPTENVSFKLKNQGPIKEGDNVQMECETDGNPQPEFEFYKEDTKLNGQKGTLTVKSIARKDAGVYKCEALDFDAAAETVLTASLNVTVHYMDPVSVTPAEPRTISKGDTVEFQCKTKASEAHTIKWKKDSKELANKGVLTIASATLADAGVYVCVGSVPAVMGLQKQANVTLNVRGAPEIEAPLPVLVNKEGAKVTLNCSARAFPAPQFTWTPAPGTESVTVEGNRVTSTVTIDATADVLKNGVSCEAYNTLGRASQKIKVSIKSNAGNDIDNSPGNPVMETAARREGGSSLVVIAVVVCVLLLLILVALLFFLNKKGKLSCGKEDKKDAASTGEKGGVVAVKMTEEAGLLNSDKSVKEK